jgi:hypothetical protein
MFAACTCIVPQASHANPLLSILQSSYEILHGRVGQVASDAVKQPVPTVAAAVSEKEGCVHEAGQGTVETVGDLVKGDDRVDVC